MSVVPDDDTIHKAAQRGDLAAVRRFIEVDGVHVDCRNIRGRSALHEAVNGRHLNRALMQPMVRYLISKNANVEAKSTSGFTPLIHASFYGHSEAVGILLEEGSANVNYCRESGATALFFACRSSNKYRAVSTLLENGADAMVHLRDGRSLLHLSTTDAESLGVLLVHCRDTLKELDFCNLLLQTDHQGERIPLHYTKSVDIAKLLIEQPRRQTDNQLLPVCQAQLVSKNRSGRTPRENIANYQDMSNAHLLSYLERYEISALSIPGDPSSSTKRHNLNMCAAVKLNPTLNDFQHSVAQEAFELIIDTTDGIDEIAHAILGYLSLLDVMKRSERIA